MVISPEERVKLLGIHFDGKLNFDHHISMICSKASRHINAISRISKYLDKSCRMYLFHAFIRSQFQYCNIIWHFTSKRNQIKLEKLQKRALQIMLNDFQSSYSVLLQKASVPSLHVSRIKNIAVKTYKCVNGLNPPFLHDLFATCENDYDLRDNCTLVQPLVRTEAYGRKSFRYTGASIWNKLPPEIKCAPDMHNFKSALDLWPGPTCACSHCILCNIQAM